MRKTVLISISLLILLVGAVAPASAMFGFVGSYGLGHSWFQTFRAINLFDFNIMRIDRVEGGGSSLFEPPVFRDFSSADWSEDAGATDSHAFARGNLTTYQMFDLNFTGVPADGITFRFAAYQGQTWRDAAEARFSNGSWDLKSLSVNQYDPGILEAVPEPRPAVLLVLGISLIVGFIAFRKQY